MLLASLKASALSETVSAGTERLIVLLGIHACDTGVCNEAMRRIHESCFQLVMFAREALLAEIFWSEKLHC